MKGSRNENNAQSKQGHVNTPRPEIRDNLEVVKQRKQVANTTIEKR